MKKPTVKSLQRRADKLWSRIVLHNAGGICERCGKKAKEAHHVFRKERNAHLRYDLRNGFALCTPCHWLTRTDPMHVDMMIAGFRGFDELESLAAAERDKTWTVKTLTHVIAGLEHGVALMEADGAR